MDNTYEWVAWCLANETTKQQGSFIVKKRPRQNPYLIEHDIKSYHWGDVQTPMEFLKQYASLEKSFPKHYVINFLKDLLNEDLVALCGLLTIEIGKPKQRLYATPSIRAWVPQHEKNEVFQLLVN